MTDRVFEVRCQPTNESQPTPRYVSYSLLYTLNTLYAPLKFNCGCTIRSCRQSLVLSAQPHIMASKLTDEEIALCRKAFAQFDKDGACWIFLVLLRACCCCVKELKTALESM